MPDNNTKMVTVCDACLTEACWQGELMCDKARTAGTTEVEAGCDGLDL